MSAYYLESDGSLCRICRTETGEPVTEPMRWADATRLCAAMNRPPLAPLSPVSADTALVSIYLCCPHEPTRRRAALALGLA